MQKFTEVRLPTEEYMSSQLLIRRMHNLWKISLSTGLYEKLVDSAISQLHLYEVYTLFSVDSARVLRQEGLDYIK